MKRPFVLAFAALVLAVTTPAIVFFGAKLELVNRTGSMIAAPLVALAVLFAFAFHVRFALGAFEQRNKPATALAWLAIVVGVTGFIGSMLTLLGIVVVR